MEQEKDSPLRGRRAVLAYVVVIAILVLASAALSYRNSTQTQLGRCLGTVFSQQRQYCINDLATSTGNASMCGYLTGYDAAGCYASIAQAKANASVCLRIADAAASSACVTGIAVADNSSALCGAVPGNYSGSCLASVAYRSMNAGACAGIGDGTAREICESEVYVELAFKDVDPVYCGMVSNDTDHAVSGAVIANGSAGSIELANASLKIEAYAIRSANDTYSARDFCDMGVAYLSGNSAGCSAIGAQELAIECGQEAAIGRGSANGASAPAPNYKAMLANCSVMGAYAENCTTYVLLADALGTRNASVCALLPNGLDENCYSSLAAEEGDASVCDLIANATVSESCRLGLNQSAS